MSLGGLLFWVIVESQGFEPWSGQGNRCAFYMLSLSLVFVRSQAGDGQTTP